MKTFDKNTTQIIQHTPVGAISSGDVVLILNRVMIAQNDIAAAATGPVFVRNISLSVTKLAGVAWAEGTRIFYDVTADSFNTVGGVYAGLATKVAASGAVTGYLDLNAAADAPGIQVLTPNAAEEVASVILPSSTRVTVGAVTTGVTDFIVLPSLADVQIGHQIIVDCAAGGAFEMRTPAASAETINGVDSDGTQEYLCTDTEVITVTTHSDGWVATALSALGAVVTAVVPD